MRVEMNGNPIKSDSLRAVFQGLLVALAGFAVLETGLRLAGVSTPIDRRDCRFSLTCDYRLPPYESRSEWQTRYVLNSRGLRDQEIPAAKQPGEYRILFMGDSCTFGTGDWLSPDETYVKITEQELLQRYPRRFIRAINAGIPGYSSFQGYQLMKELLPAYAPDLVVVYYGWNDHWMDYFNEREKFVLNHIDYVLNASRVFTVMKRLVLRNDHYFTIKRSRFWEIIGKRRKVRISETAYRDTLTAMIRFCGKHGAGVVLVTAPAEYRNAKPDAGWFTEQPFATLALHPAYNQVVRDIAAREQVYLVDLAALFDRLNDRGNFSDFVHPNRKGQRVIGQFLGAYLGDRVIISGGGS
jgi:lysophospholipase L1-like esterase